MIKRHLENTCFHQLFGRQMRFIAGPRQVGKTTLVKNFLESKQLEKLYFKMKCLAGRDQDLLDLKKLGFIHDEGSED
ncbi:MAG: hypothetical protein JSV88_19345 [Candidatus Aminicenantes bacterium]|nr:MAG: hypothetical protein JSV88_19345 [Candidatus Aminicenantes bacterium]